MPAGHPAGRRGSPEDLVQVLRAEGIGDRRVLAAFGTVPRARFVPPAAVDEAYLDVPIRIPHGQVTTQPSLIAAMVAALGLTGSERVLEVGTGLGFQTAILAELAGEVSVERFADWLSGRGPTWPRPGWTRSGWWSATAPWACPIMPPIRRSWWQPPLLGSLDR